MATYKYEPLKNYLKSSNMEINTLRFDEINEILGSELPPCLSGKDGRTKLLWNNNIVNYATRSWLEAGYVFFEYSLKDASVSFKKDASKAEMYLHKN